MKKILLIVLLIISFNIVSNAQLKNRKIIDDIKTTSIIGTRNIIKNAKNTPFFGNFWRFTFLSKPSTIKIQKAMPNNRESCR